MKLRMFHYLFWADWLQNYMSIFKSSILVVSCEKQTQNWTDGMFLFRVMLATSVLTMTTTHSWRMASLSAMCQAVSTMPVFIHTTGRTGWTRWGLGDSMPSKREATFFFFLLFLWMQWSLVIMLTSKIYASSSSSTDMEVLKLLLFRCVLTQGHIKIEIHVKRKENKAVHFQWMLVLQWLNNLFFFKWGG